MCFSAAARVSAMSIGALESRGTSALVGKSTAVMSASMSPFGGVWAQAELRKALAASGARVHDEGVALSKAGERIDADGRLVDGDIIDEMVALIDELRALALIPLEAW